jgi:hypothetical protein
VVKSDSIFQVNQHACKAITLRTPGVTMRYYYSPQLLTNPVYDSTNTIGHFNTYTRETGGAIYLWVHSEYPIASMTDSCVRVDPKKIDDHLFDLPALPVKKFEIATLFKPARFSSSPNGWLGYDEIGYGGLDGRGQLQPGDKLSILLRQ